MVGMAIKHRLKICDYANVSNSSLINHSLGIFIFPIYYFRCLVYFEYFVYWVGDFSLKSTCIVDRWFLRGIASLLVLILNQ